MPKGGKDILPILPIAESVGSQPNISKYRVFSMTEILQTRVGPGESMEGKLQLRAYVLGTGHSLAFRPDSDRSTWPNVDRFATVTKLE